MKKIKFIGPYSWQPTDDLPSIIDSPESKNSYGIYLWTVQMSDGMLISYVGQTGVSFSQRLNQHLSCQNFGEYKIYDVNRLKDGERKYIWAGKTGAGGRKDFRTEFEKRRDELSPHLEELISTYRFYIAPFKGPERLRLRIEAAIAEHLKAQRGRVGNFHEPGVRYSPRTGDEARVKIQIFSDDKLIGVPKKLFV